METEYTKKIVKGKRILKSGEIKEYTYERTVEVKKPNKRGAKPKPNKSKLREMLKKLSDAECEDIINYIEQKKEIHNAADEL